MNSPAEIMFDTATTSVGASPWKQRPVFTIGFVIVNAVAMLGWLTGLTSAAISAVNWLLS